MTTSLLSLFLVLAVLSTANGSSSVNRPINSAFVPVTERDQLWRYTVGHGNRLSVGDRYIALNYKGYAVGGYGSSFSASLMSRPDDRVRFEIEFLHGNTVVLKLKDAERYLSCSDDGSAELVTWKGRSAEFEATIGGDENHLLLYNPAVDGSLHVTGRHGLDCNGFGHGSRVQFTGWKLGPREAWRPTDRWQMIGYFDNRHSQSNATYAYETTVGVRQTIRSEAYIPDEAWVYAGPDLYATFVKKIVDPIVDWRDTPPESWEPEKRIRRNFDVKHGTAVKLYQAVGQYGVFMVRSNFIQVRNDEEGNFRERSMFLA